MPVRVALSFIFGEIVFYGGLIGGVAAMLIFCKSHKIPVLPIADLFAPALAIAHGFGRIGCFFGGCCYGIQVNPSHPFAVIFPPAVTSVPAATGTSITTGTLTGIPVVTDMPVLATQLIEAASLFVIAVILIIIYKKTAGTGITVCTYGVLYSILRFTLEFYRGDNARGMYGAFSVSQYISIALFVVSVVMVGVIIKKTTPAVYDGTPFRGMGYGNRK
jgi:phosphatidylglycerol:prolipoprotein diacylglycerol transferase